MRKTIAQVEQAISSEIKILRDDISKLRDEVMMLKGAAGFISGDYAQVNGPVIPGQPLGELLRQERDYKANTRKYVESEYSRQKEMTDIWNRLYGEEIPLPVPLDPRETNPELFTDDE